jgi:hypothetical protein
MATQDMVSNHGSGFVGGMVLGLSGSMLGGLEIPGM